MLVGKMKEKYETPRVTEYGNFEDITKQGTGKGSVPEDEAGRMPPGQDR